MNINNLIEIHNNILNEIIMNVNLFKLIINI